ncbi:hypothetical protein D3C71_2243190 [compost metagenome]
MLLPADYHSVVGGQAGTHDPEPIDERAEFDGPDEHGAFGGNGKNRLARLVHLDRGIGDQQGRRAGSAC